MDEALGIKLKDVSVEPEVKEDLIQVINDKDESFKDIDTSEIDDLFENDEEPDNDDEVTVIRREDVIKDEPEEVLPVDYFKKVACARLLTKDGTTVYRFDIFHKEYRTDSGTFEFRNIVNNFKNVKATRRKDYQQFFTAFGIIRWNFSQSLMPINTNYMSAITQIESLVNEQIYNTGIFRKYEFRIETVME